MKFRTTLTRLSAVALLALACEPHVLGVSGAPASIVVTPNVTLPIGGTQQFVAVARDADNLITPITPVWTASAGGTINATGFFTAGNTLGVFTNNVTATANGLSGSATVTVVAGALASITVTPNPDTTTILGTQQFVAVGRDAGNNIIPITPVWSVTNSGGTINAASGLFTAGNTAGTFANTVRATSGAVFGTATVVVAAGALSSITVTPNPDTTAILDTQQFVAVGRDVGNNIVPITPVWSVTNSGGTINAASGLFTAGNVANTFTNTVRATSGAVFGTATVVVAAGPLATIAVTPNPDTTATLATQQFTAVGRDASNNIVPITPVWSVTNGGGAVNGTGLFTAGNVAGTFANTVRATSGAIFGSATVVVTSLVTPPFVPLGNAEFHGILAGTQITCITNGLISADVGVSPGSTLTGFGPCVFTGVANLANAVAAQAQADLTTAYNTLAGLACPPANAIVADLGGTTLAAGVYCSAIGIGVSGPLTLNGGGDPDAVFVFQAGSSLTTAGDIVLINGAQAKNVYWQVGSSATLGTASQWKGNILALTSITLVDNANLIGRALARNGGVSLGSNNTITLP